MYSGINPEMSVLDATRPPSIYLTHFACVSIPSDPSDPMHACLGRARQRSRACPWSGGGITINPNYRPNHPTGEKLLVFILLYDYCPTSYFPGGEAVANLYRHFLFAASHCKLVGEDVKGRTRLATSSRVYILSSACSV
jgi:hypothetical protein